MSQRSKRRVWKTPKAGAMKDLTLREEELGELKKDEVRVRVRAVGLNFADIFAIVGMYSATPEGPFIPGLEFAGEIEAVGEEAREDYAPGDRVRGATRFGGYVSVIDMDPLYLEPLPDDWTYPQGAAYPVQTLTAWYALKALGDLKEGQNVLVHSAAGGVGLQAMKICRALGARPLGTVGRDFKKEFLSQKGFEEVAVRKGDWAGKIRKFLGEENLLLALDAIGGNVQRQSYQLLGPMGRLIVFGSAEFAPGKNRPQYLKMIWKYLTRPTYDPLEMITENKSVMAFNLIWLYDRTEYLLPQMEEMKELDLDPPHVGHEFDFSEAHEALDLLRRGESVGKVVLNVRESENRD